MDSYGVVDALDGSKPGLDLIKPRALRPGDLLGVVAPAGPPDEAALDRGIRRLGELGFTVRLGRHVRSNTGYLAGSDEERLTDLLDMFADPTVKGIVCARGGYGSLRLVPRLDPDVIRRNPKVFVGYSDITALHIAFSQKTGLVTFHGPMVASDFGREPSSSDAPSLQTSNPLSNSFTEGSFVKAVTEPRPLGTIRNPAQAPKILTIAPGMASGPVTGGNLSLVVATLGSPFEIDLRGKILILEETGEEPYRVDRMLTQLIITGKLKHVSGLIFGEIPHPILSENSEKHTGRAGPSIEDVLLERLCPLNIPCFYGLAVGHGLEKATVPLGVRATMDAEEGFLRIDEAATVP
ncbi:MAG: LD-carboxypeptidase [Firmicutes bacterium]|nr:LD-carboxypeptidase [Bacillota bacterium]